MAITVTITIVHDEVLKRVRNKTHKLAKSSGIKDPRIEANLQADDTAQDTKIVKDAISKAVGNLVNAMSRYVDDTLNNEDSNVIKLLMPDIWRINNAEGMTEDIYNYITEMSMSEFLSNAGDVKNSSLHRGYANEWLFDAMRKFNDRKSPIS